jgi:D-alanyl-D-alanine carboxypeptidase
VDGIAAITSRIAEIRGTLASVSATPISRTTSGTTTSASGTSATFASALATEVAQSSSVGGAAGVGKLDAKGNPADLAMYGNGKIPASALTSIGSGQQMWTPAARQFQQMSAAAARDGVTIGVTDSYRTYESQVDLAERKGLYSQGGLAATPGTSDHGWGRALDLKLDSSALAWMRENGATYGFKEDVPRESWHWTYYPPGS